MSTQIELIQGDITKQKVDAIVNAANQSLMGGGGVDGAIHRAGGPKILEACKEIVQKTGRCGTGKAVITTGGNLPAQFVIHTVGPVWSMGQRNEPALLKECYENCLKLAAAVNCKTIAIPSISTGAYRFPVQKACAIALETVKKEIEKYNLEKVVFVLFSQSDFDVYAAELEGAGRIERG